MSKIKAIFYGIIAASGATVFQQLILILLNIEFIDTTHLTPLLIFGAFSEEIFKFIVIYKTVAETESRKIILILSLMIGLGFSLVEIAFKFWSYSQQKFIPINFSNYLGVILIHMLTAGIIGYYSTLKNSSYLWIFFGILIALSIHLLYNALIIYVF